MSSLVDKSKKTSKTMSVKKRIAAALKVCGFAVRDATSPFRYHSHCAAMDAPAFAIHNLGVNGVCEVASEIDPHAALFHMVHHPNTHHLIADMKYVSKKTCGPCITHGGQMCTWSSEEGQLDCVASSFVCTPWTKANPKRFKADPVRTAGEDNSVDTFRHTRAIIKKFLPKTFALENVDGVNAVRTSDSTDTVLDYMLDDPEHGLRTIKSKINGVEKDAYTVEVVRTVKGTDFGLPQDRPRTLFFGVRIDMAQTAQDVATKILGDREGLPSGRWYGPHRRVCDSKNHWQAVRSSKNRRRVRVRVRVSKHRQSVERSYRLLPGV